ncbi:OmpH family outer membrane protein [Wenyingzhuangia sp. 2_MG-2023]|uniref:OmpH family outer membrane protein n=1 Tax=Wenyingzhuangia sp. 2_MG-2023 TaxID=3062639 RepID=UPI0026E1EB14|nr:OmpH family outer membrane protein [Wenyingzhuangia sp. 2_MG-2023]MDO6736435.1 OmpH family outer membrane protein [Wenyingzhuangia sp. 2_MG-2023]MDO6801253.1 OmpH family outer membrane protein [Wenyingzhuangia sp. 1_MG-2023]
MIISSIINTFIKKLFLVIVFCAFSIQAQIQQQQLQRIGFVDMEYVLEQIPSYTNAQDKLNAETTLWKKNLDKMYLKLETLKKEYLNEKPLLTEDLIEDREVEIKNYENEIVKAENTYFGVEGKLFELRKKLVTPYQDLVYNAVQTVAKLRKYDMIFEKSSSIVMLYTNNNYDISDLVLKYIQKSEKEIEAEEAQLKKEEARKAREKRIEEQRQKREELRIKREEERQKRLNK